MTRTYRSELDLDADTLNGRAPGAPGKVPTTARLGGGTTNNFVFRVESAEAARALGEAFAPRDDNGVSAGADAHVERAASSPGSELPADLRGRFESSLGTDLSAVRIHTGVESQTAAAAVGAKAYATGQDVHFGAGQYDPTSSDGQFLIAHEVAHTVQQQGAAPTRQNKLEVSAPADMSEVEADRAATAMLEGAPFALASSGVGIARKPGASGKVTTALSISSFKSSGEIGAKFSKDLGKLKADGFVGLYGEGEIQWLDLPVSAGGALSLGADQGKGGSGDATGKFDISVWKDKGAKQVYQEGEKNWEDKLVPSEVKLVFDVPKLKESQKDGDEQSFAVGLQVKTVGGGSATLKGGFSLANGLTGPNGTLTFEIPIADTERTVGSWEGGDVKVKGKFVLKVEAAIKPNWAELGKEVLEKVTKEGGKEVLKQATTKGSQEVVKKGAQEIVKKGAQEAGKDALGGAAEEAATDAAVTGAGEGGALETGLAAMSAEAVIAVGGALALVGSLAYAFTKSVAQLADLKGLKAEGQAEVDAVYQGALFACGAGGAVSTLAGGQTFAVIDSHIWGGVAKIMANPKYKDLVSKGELTIIDVRTAIQEGAIQAGIPERARAAARSQIANRCAQEYYNKHFDDFLGGEGVEMDARLMAKTIYAHIMGGGFDSWNPGPGVSPASAPEPRVDPMDDTRNPGTHRGSI